MPRRPGRIGLIAVLASLAAAAPAAGQNALFNDFKGDGVITPCKYTDQQLQNGLNALPPDIRQYAPGFGDQLNAARGAPCGAAPAARKEAQQRERAAAGTTGGDGGGGGGGSPTGGDRIPAPPAPKPSPLPKLATAPAPDVSVAPSSSDGASQWLLIALGLVAASGAAVVLLARSRGFSAERFTRPLRAALAEGGGRAWDALADLRDRARPGR